MRFREETEQFALCSVQALQLCSMFLQSDMFMSCAVSCSCWCRSVTCFFRRQVHALHRHTFMRCTVLARALALGGGGRVRGRPCSAGRSCGTVLHRCRACSFAGLGRMLQEAAPADRWTAKLLAYPCFDHGFRQAVLSTRLANRAVCARSGSRVSGTVCLRWGRMG